MKYYLDAENRIRLIRYGVTYEEKNYNSNVSKVERKKFFEGKEEADVYKQELDSEGINYTFEEFETGEFEFLEGRVVEDEKEADFLINTPIDKLISIKRRELSETCQETIYGGIELELSDGTKNCFSLTIEDQININTLLSQVSEGQKVPYHANGELCTLYEVSDFIELATKAKEFVMYHTTYYNHLTHHIKSLESREDVFNAYYGMPLNEELTKSLNKILGVENVE